MKKIKLILSIAIIALFNMGMLTAQENDYEILNSSEITVKSGHNAQFVEGVKLWKECYLENEGNNSWTMWRRQQGKGNVYIMSGFMDKWAEMEEENTAGKACYAIYLNFIHPHIESQSSRTSITMPDVSKKSSEGTKFIYVTSYDVHNGADFRTVVNTVTDAIKKKEGDYRAYWYEVRLGGPDAPDYFVSMPLESMAALDVKKDSPAKIYTDLVGEEKAQEMWDLWFGTVKNSWSYIYEKQSELSN